MSATAAASRLNAVPLGAWPRGLSRVQAASYVGVSPSLFDGMVKDGRMPGPIRANSRAVWDIRKLDEAFTALDKADSADDPWGQMAP